MPDEVEYLVEWARTLHGRSGSGFSGPALLSPSEIESYTRQMDIAPLHPWEFEALMVLDAAFLYKEDKYTEDPIIPEAIEE
ncbi:MAG: phage tail assembly chaperone [bacterium]